MDLEKTSLSCHMLSSRVRVNVSNSGGVNVMGVYAGDSRYSFTPQFLCASAIFARRSKEIELCPETPDDQTLTEHRGLVTAAIMQSVAAVESEISEVMLHGPAHHLGSHLENEKDTEFLAKLQKLTDGKPAWKKIDRKPAIFRYNLILHRLGKTKLPEDASPWEPMKTLVDLRNEMVHYKSRWENEMGRDKKVKSFQNLRLEKPSFVSDGSNFFPHKLLGAACAGWSVHTAVTFINAFYQRLEVESPLKPYMVQFDGTHPL